jgi:hypothetical protein
MPPSGVVAMWKDPVRGVREIPLESGAQGVLLKAVQGRSPRYAADGRRPADDATDLYVAGIQQLRAAPSGQAERSAGTDPHTVEHADGDLLDTVELSILYSWAEAVAHALAATPAGAHARTDDAVGLDHVLAEAAGARGWREWLALPAPSARLDYALETLGRLGRDALEGAATAGRPPATTDLVAALQSLDLDDPLERLVRRALAIALDLTRRS